MKKNEVFRFKKFEIAHEINGQKVSTDSVLLGAWADIVNSDTVLDIGTGCGVLAMICAQRNPNAEITAIEIEKSFAEEAEMNFKNSIYSNRITIIQADIRTYQGEKFDSIICNPPYFSADLKSPDSKRNNARHDLHLDFQALAESAIRLLKDDGNISVVIPNEKFIPFFEIFEAQGFVISRICRIKYLEKSDPSLLLLQFNLNGIKVTEETELIIKAGEEYSGLYKNLLRDFLTIF